MKKALSVAVILFLTVAILSSCQTDQDQIYSQTVHGSGASEFSGTSSEHLEAESSSKPLIRQSLPREVDYEASNYIGPPPPGTDAKLTPVPGDALSGQLHIKTYEWWGDPPEIYWLAREFMELHPNVEISFDYDLTYTELRTLDRDGKYRREKAFYDRIRVELASGEADYLLFSAVDSLNYPQMAQNGILTDLRSYWENDPEIDPAEYFMEVVNAFSVDGKLPVIPFGFAIQGIFLNRAMLAEIGAALENAQPVDSDDILGWYEKARELYPDLQLFYTASGKDTLFPAERFRYMDLESGAASFDSPDFVKFLERTRAVINEEPELDPIREVGRGHGALFDENLRYDVTGKPAPSIVHYAPGVSLSGPTNDENITEKGRESFASVESLTMYPLAVTQQPFEYVAGPFPLVSTDGKLGIEAYRFNFALPSSCKNSGLAWEFIKYCSSEREDLGFDCYGYTACGNYINTYLPVNKKNFAKMAEGLPEAVKSGYSAGYLHFDPIDGQKMMETMEQFLSMNPLDVAKYNLDVRDILDEYYRNELTTPEQCAEKIQGRTEIWLGE